MRILITNDDGINAPGIAALETIAAALSDDVWVVAPAEEQSGAGHSLTLSRPVRVRRHGERRPAQDCRLARIAFVMEGGRPRPPGLRRRRPVALQTGEKAVVFQGRFTVH